MLPPEAFRSGTLYSGELAASGSPMTTSLRERIASLRPPSRTRPRAVRGLSFGRCSSKTRTYPSARSASKYQVCSLSPARRNGKGGSWTLSSTPPPPGRRTSTDAIDVSPRPLLLTVTARTGCVKPCELMRSICCGVAVDGIVSACVPLLRPRAMSTLTRLPESRNVHACHPSEAKANRRPNAAITVVAVSEVCTIGAVCTTMGPVWTTIGTAALTQAPPHMPRAEQMPSGPVVL